MIKEHHIGHAWYGTDITGEPFVMPGTLLSRKSPPKRISHSKYQKWRRHSISSNGLMAKELVGTNLIGYREFESQ